MGTGMGVKEENGSEVESAKAFRLTPAVFTLLSTPSGWTPETVVGVVQKYLRGGRVSPGE